MTDISCFDLDEIRGFVSFSKELYPSCSENTIIFTADGGNHFTNYGIYEGTLLFIDTEKSYLKGHLSCFKNINDDLNPKFRMSDVPLDGYEHFGRLVYALRNYEVC